MWLSAVEAFIAHKSSFVNASYSAGFTFDSEDVVWALSIVEVLLMYGSAGLLSSLTHDLLAVTALSRRAL